MILLCETKFIIFLDTREPTKMTYNLCLIYVKWIKRLLIERINN